MRYIPDTQETQWGIIRARRNQLLQDSDYTQLADVGCNKPQWVTYRQALRDVTMQTDPYYIVWPTPPQ